MRRLTMLTAAAGLAISNRTLAKGAVSVILPVGLLVSIATLGGTASASGPDVTCTGVTGSMNFNPALGTGNKKEKITFTRMALQGCEDVAESPAVPVTFTSVNITLKDAHLTDNCLNFNFDTASVTIKASVGNGQPAKLTFPRGAVNLEAAYVGVVFDPGKATGSFSGPFELWKMTFDSQSQMQLDDCSGTISSASIGSGEATL